MPNLVALLNFREEKGSWWGGWMKSAKDKVLIVLFENLLHYLMLMLLIVCFSFFFYKFYFKVTSKSRFNVYAVHVAVYIVNNFLLLQ